MGNIALNKNADASSYINPFTAERGVNGTATPISRWIGSSPLPPGGAIPQPVWMRVDLGAECWINRWVVRQLGSIGWSTDYNLTDYKFQGSLDKSSWFDMDSIVNNSASVTDRTFIATKARWVRVYITKGCRNDTNFASIAELEVYDAPTTDSTLSALTLNNGTATVPTTPSFAGTVTSYTASVNYDTTQITVTAATTDSRATIKVNGVSVQQNQASQWINLTAGGITPVNVVVTPYIGDPRTYTVNVTRASSPYLSNLVLKAGRNQLTLVPTFINTTLNYSSNANSAPGVTVTPTAEDANATIKVNNVIVSSGQVSGVISLNEGVNTVTVELTSFSGGDVKNYVILVTR